MSTTIIPDIYRHTARKSTVSRNVKPPSKNVSLCNSIFDTIQCDIKLEKDSPQQLEQSVIILPENEIEQMVVEQTNEEIICDILEHVKNQIENSDQTDSLVNNFDENDTEESVNTTGNHSLSTTNDVQMDDVTRSLNEGLSMESEAQSSVLSRSQIDDEIVEIGVPATNTHAQSCTCQCHQTTSDSLLTNPTNEYLLFEQVLQQTRQDQQQERSLNNNRLVQTLKHQHQELMKFYQRQLYINKIDREQQTIQINQHDSQIQTDFTTIQQQNLKPNNHVNGTHSTPKPKGPTATMPRPFNSFLTPIRTTGPSLQQLIPCLSTTTTSTTTTITNKIAVVKKPSPVVTTNAQPALLPLSSSTSSSHDVVDLTEEDEEDNRNRSSAQRTSSVRPQQSSASTPSSTATAIVTTRIQPTNQPNTTVPLGQAFPLRPLPEQIPCDHTIARPQLSITQDNTTVRLTWNLPSTPMESIQTYEIYAYKQNTAVATSDWKKIGTVKSMRLPMAVTLKEFQSNSHYAFAVRAVSIQNHIGPFCEPKTIFTGNTSVHPLNTSQILNVSS